MSSPAPLGPGDTALRRHWLLIGLAVIAALALGYVAGAAIWGEPSQAPPAAMPVLARPPEPSSAPAVRALPAPGPLPALRRRPKQAVTPTPTSPAVPTPTSPVLPAPTVRPNPTPQATATPAPSAPTPSGGGIIGGGET